MLGSVRAAVPRVVPRQATLARTIITKSERWTPAVVQNAQQMVDGPNALELSKVLPNFEAQWAKLSREEQYSVYKQLEEVQRKDWKQLSADEQRAAYYVSYGAYGPRKPVAPEGNGMRVLLGSLAGIGLGVALFLGIRSLAAPAPKSMTREYQEQMTERAKETKQNPITGIASEGYKGKGHVI